MLEPVEKWSNYTAFGSPMPGRKYLSSSSYRYGFNGKENDQETVSTGEGTQDYGMRIYNPALGRWLSRDPLAAKYPDWSPYKAFNDNPVIYTDPDGGDEFLTIVSVNKKTGKSSSMVIKLSNEVFTDNIKHQMGGECWYYEKNWYDKSTTVVIATDEKGKVSTSSSSRLLKDKVKSTTSGALINSSMYATMKSELFEADGMLDERMKQIADEVSKEYGGSPTHVKDPVTTFGSDNLSAWLHILKGEIGDIITNWGTDVSESDKAKASSKEQVKNAKQGDTLIEIYGDGDGNWWYSPSVKDTTEGDGTRNVGGEASEEQVKKYGGNDE